MIERYSFPEMAKIWTEENRFQEMLDVEILLRAEYTLHW